MGVSSCLDNLGKLKAGHLEDIDMNQTQSNRKTIVSFFILLFL